MNKLLPTLFLLLLFSNAHAENENCNCELPKLIDEYLDSEQEKYQIDIDTKELTDEEIKLVVQKLCVNIMVARSGEFQKEKFKNIILEALEVPQSTSERAKNEIISSFLNTYKDKLICRESRADATDRDLHLFKTAALEGIIDLYDEILLNDDEFNIDFNAYEIVNGKKETIIDYLDMMIDSNKYDNDELTLLRDDIIETGGKRGHEL